MKLKWIFTLLFVAVFNNETFACAVCGGSTDARVVDAANMVLWTLLALVGFIFTATGATIYFIVRKSSQPIPPHIELIESISSANAVNH